MDGWGQQTHWCLGAWRPRNFKREEYQAFHCRLIWIHPLLSPGCEYKAEHVHVPPSILFRAGLNVQPLSLTL
jgi:hypothetical protein